MVRPIDFDRLPILSGHRQVMAERFLVIALITGDSLIDLTGNRHLEGSDSFSSQIPRGHAGAV